MKIQLMMKCQTIFHFNKVDIVVLLDQITKESSVQALVGEWTALVRKVANQV